MFLHVLELLVYDALLVVVCYAIAVGRRIGYAALVGVHILVTCRIAQLNLVLCLIPFCHCATS